MSWAVLHGESSVSEQSAGELPISQKLFGAKVIYYSASGAPAQKGYRQVDFDTLLTESDILSIHAPLNEYTENLMNAEAFHKNEAGRHPAESGQGTDRK